MAGNIFLPIKAIFDDIGIKQAQKAFGKLGSGLKTTLGAVGVGIGFGAIVSQLGAAAKAASDDAKSQILLAQQMRNTADASDSQIASVEQSINKLSIMAAVADDELRPAMASLVRATGNVTDAQDLLALSLDVSAATGKDLQSVSLAIGKAVAGQTSQLFRMIPALKGSGDWMAKLRESTSGMAEAAGNADPYMRLNIVFDEMQETIGQALLPIIKDFADYMSSNEGQQSIDEFATSIGDMAAAIQDLIAAGSALKPILDPIFGYLNGLLAAFAGNSDRATEIFSGIFSFIPGAYNPREGMNAGEAGRYNAQAEWWKAKAAYEASLKSPGLNPKGGSSSANAMADAAKAAAEAARKFAEAYKKILESEKQIYQDALDAAIASRKAILDMRDAFATLYDGVKPLQRAGAAIGEFEQQVVDSFKAIEDQIASSLADGTLLDDAAANLRAYAASEKATLSAIARQRDALTKKIEIAKSISAGVLALGDVTTLLDKQTRTVTETFTRMVDGVTVATTRSFDEITQGGLVDNFKKVIDKTKAFAKNLIELKRLGLNGQLFKQIVSAGVDAGGDTAQAIADGGKATVTELNDLFGQLNDLGGQVAAASTDVMYQAGEDVMNSFIQSLLDQDKALEDTATSLATKFAEAFRNTLVALSPLMALPMNTSDISLSDALNGYVSDQLGRTFTGPYNYYGQQMVGGLGANYNVTINAGAVADKASLPGIIVDALATYTRNSGSGALNKVLSI